MCLRGGVDTFVDWRICLGMPRVKLQLRPECSIQRDEGILVPEFKSPHFSPAAIHVVAVFTWTYTVLLSDVRSVRDMCTYRQFFCRRAYCLPKYPNEGYYGGATVRV